MIRSIYQNADFMTTVQCSVNAVKGCKTLHGELHRKLQNRSQPEGTQQAFCLHLDAGIYPPVFEWGLRLNLDGYVKLLGDSNEPLVGKCCCWKELCVSVGFSSIPCLREKSKVKSHYQRISMTSPAPISSLLIHPTICNHMGYLLCVGCG